MKYDFNFFHQQLLLLQNQDFEYYKNTSEFDIFFSVLSNDEIYDYYEIAWEQFSNHFITEIVETDASGYFTNSFCAEDNRLEELCNYVYSREVRIKLLLFFQQNIDLVWPNIKNAAYIEKECARLISKNIKESVNDQYHGTFAEMPRPDYKKMIANQNLFHEQTIYGQVMHKICPSNIKSAVNEKCSSEVQKEVIELRKQVAELTKENQKLCAQLEKPLSKSKKIKIDNKKNQISLRRVQEALFFRDVYIRRDLTSTQFDYIEKELKVACSKRNAGVAVAEVLCNSTNKATYLAIANVPNTDLYYSLVKTYGLTVAPSTFYDAMRKAQKP